MAGVMRVTSSACDWPSAVHGAVDQGGSMNVACVRPIVQPEELADSDAQKAMTLGQAVLRRLSARVDTIDDGLRDQEPIERDSLEDLVSVPVIAHAQTTASPSLCDEIEARVDEILGI